MNPQMIRITHDLLVVRAKHLIDTGRLVWTEVEPPEPRAMRALQGMGDGFLLLVQQGNISNAGEPPHLDYHMGGMYTGLIEGSTTAMVLHFTKDEANQIYHQITAKRN